MLLDFVEPIFDSQFSVKTLIGGEQLESIQVAGSMISNGGLTAIVPIPNGAPTYDEIQLMWRDSGEKVVLIRHIAFSMNGEFVYDEWPITAVNSAIVERL